MLKAAVFERKRVFSLHCGGYVAGGGEGGSVSASVPACRETIEQTTQDGREDRKKGSACQSWRYNKCVLDLCRGSVNTRCRGLQDKHRPEIDKGARGIVPIRPECEGSGEECL